MARFIVRDGAAPGTEYPLPANVPSLEIDSASGDMRVSDENGGHERASILRRGDDVLIRDPGGPGPALLNGERVEGEARISFGDRVRIGDTVYEYAADEEDVAKALAGGSDSPGPEADAGGGVIDALRALPPRTKLIVGLAAPTLLVALLLGGVLLMCQGTGPEGDEDAAQEAPASPAEGPGVAETVKAAGPEKRQGPGWYAVLTERLAESVSSVAAASGDGTGAGKDSGLRDMAARLLADAGDETPAKSVEPDVDDLGPVPAKEPEGDIDFEAEEKAKAEAEKRAAANRKPDADDPAARTRPKRATTASGNKVDADVLLAPLPRTATCRLKPKPRRPVTDADRAEISSVLETLTKLKSAPRYSLDSYRKVKLLKRLAGHDDPRVSRSLAFLANDRDPRVRTALVDTLAAHDNPESARMLLALMMLKDGGMGGSAATALASLRDEKTVEWLYTSALKRAGSRAARAAVAEVLGRIGEERAVPHLVKALGDSGGEVRAAAAIALGRLRHKDAVKDLVRAVRDRDMRVRIAALLALGSIREPSAAEDVIKRLEDREPAVRSAAARALGALRVEESVKPLVEALDREPSRVKDDIIRALTLITALRFDDNMLAWKNLVKDPGGRLLVADLALAASVLDEIEAGNVEYYGIKTHSTRICFVVDISGSMTGKALADAKAELNKAIERFTVKHFFNMIFFSHKPRVWQKRLVQANRVVLARAKAYIELQKATGGTNIYDSVILALRDPLVDTIFLLTDGRSGSGVFTEPDEMRAGIRKANVRGVVIHCIGLGAHDREFMEGLAKDTGGKYVVPEERVK